MTKLKRVVGGLLSLFCVASLTVPISAQTPEAAPRAMPTSSDLTLDYTQWSRVLSKAVLPMGDSLRTRAVTKETATGSRFAYHVGTQYRFEGNKVLYPYFRPEMTRQLERFTDFFVRIANTVEIETLAGDEQLAFWINLHNALVLREVSEHYPGPKRDVLKIRPSEESDATLHEAKLVTIRGRALSLRDIRETIVFPNWTSPDVAFAFHLGHGSGPSMRESAYSAATLSRDLEDNAFEFVNALRGYRNGKYHPYLREIAPWYFPDFEADLQSYLKARMRPKNYETVLEHGIKRAQKADLTPADITQGRGLRSGKRGIRNVRNDLYDSGVNVRNAEGGNANASRHVIAFLRERELKLQKLEELAEERRGVVTIEDTPTEPEPTTPVP